MKFSGDISGCYLCIFFLKLVHIIKGGNVFVYPYGHCLNSHLLTMEKVIHVIVKAGHNVTMLVPETYTGPHVNADFRNVKSIRFKVPAYIEPMCGFDSLGSFLETSTTQLWQKFQESTLGYCEALLKDKNILKHLKEARFNLAIFEHVDYCSRILAEYIDVPFISLVSQGMESVYPRTPTHMPTILSCYTDQMTMFQRLKNTLVYGFQKIFVALTLRKYEKLKAKFQLNKTVSLEGTPDKAQVKFVVGHHAIDYPGPMLPSSVLISNLNSALPRQKLAPDTKKFLDGSPGGVIYLSFGSMIKGWDKKWQKIFLEAFRNLPYKILWKTDQSNITNLHYNDDNIKTIKWASQPEILMHPNVILFITHSGLNSVLEAARAGKPVVAIPLFADQFYQAKKLTERAQIGKELDIHTLTSEKLSETVKQTVKNKRFRENAKYISSIMRENPVSDERTIIYWVEFVMKHKGAPHLRSKVQSMSWYEVILLDCAAVLLALFIVIITSCKLFKHHINLQKNSVTNDLFENDNVFIKHKR